MKLIYIAGPYTAPTACERMANIQRARQLAAEIRRFYGDLAFAVVPHFLSSGIEDSLSPDGWYMATLEVMRRCDAVLHLVPWLHSKGTSDEINEAESRGMPIFTSADLKPSAPGQKSTLFSWLKSP